MAAAPLTAEQQQRRRDWFRDHWTTGVAFNAHCDMAVERWDADGVTIRLPFADHLSAHEGIFHGGVISALIDTTGSAAVIAGHDFDLGSRLTTVSLSVNYFSVAPGEDAFADARCTRRGGRLHFAEVAVRSESGKPLAQGLVAVNIAGRRPGLPDALSDSSPDSLSE
jgi:uncharacterized protein (TIGR00369 family)